MARETNLQLRNSIIYSVYVRNHTKEGSFRALEADLPRIRSLGADVIWLMPIHPIGVAGRKGTLGCPYANRDYRSVNPEYGSLADFRHLVEAIHRLGMKCIIDVVYNHTAPDATLRREHPEFYYRDAQGRFGNRFGDWSDVIDLDYRVRELWAYQIESLKYWAGLVDGFRCDVASLVPVDFWRAARDACREVREGMIWLAETVHLSFNRAARRAGLQICTDSEAYEAFDMEYDYDIRELLDDYWAGKRPLHEWIDALNGQEAVYPANHIKLRCVENHDQPRIASRFSDAQALDNWHAFLYFQKGATLLYGGEECSDSHQPSLFERDPVNWTGRDVSALLTRLAQIKRTELPAEGWFSAEALDDEHAVIARRGGCGREVMGIFSLRGQMLDLRLEIADGSYRDLISGGEAVVRGGRLRTDGRPLIFRLEK